MKNPLDYDSNGEVNLADANAALKDAKRKLDESEASGHMKFGWGLVAGMAIILVPYVLYKVTLG